MYSSKINVNNGLSLGKRLDVSEVVQVPMRRSIFAWVKIVLLVVLLVAFSYLSLSYYLDANKVSEYLFSIYSEIVYNNILTLIKDEPRILIMDIPHLYKPSLQNVQALF